MTHWGRFFVNQPFWGAWRLWATAQRLRAVAGSPVHMDQSWFQSKQLPHPMWGPAKQRHKKTSCPRGYHGIMSSKPSSLYLTLENLCFLHGLDLGEKAARLRAENRKFTNRLCGLQLEARVFSCVFIVAIVSWGTWWEVLIHHETQLKYSILRHTSILISLRTWRVDWRDILECHFDRCTSN